MTPLPPREEVRVLGHGKARAIRILYRERCSVDEIRAALGVTGAYVSQCLRWKAGPSPLVLRRSACTRP